MDGPSIIFQSHIASDICLGIISMQFKTCTMQNFEKNVLVVATKDSSVLAFDSDTGNMLSASMVRPKKPSRALFMQILGMCYCPKSIYWTYKPDNPKYKLVSNIYFVSIVEFREKVILIYIFQIGRIHQLGEQIYQLVQTWTEGVLLRKAYQSNLTYWYVLRRLHMSIPWFMPFR